MTPLWFHVLDKKHVRKMSNAGIVLSLNKLSWRYDNLTFVIEK
jgi:hypothetical protein